MRTSINRFSWDKDRVIPFIIGLSIILAVLGNIFYFTVFPHVTKDIITVEVTDKERINKSSRSVYLIFTEGETFANHDSVARWKFRSSDLYGQIKRGKTYTFHVYGWRIPIFSLYRNIVTATLVDTVEDKEVSHD